MLREFLAVSAVVSSLMAGAFWMTPQAHAQDQYVAQVNVFASNYCPRGWARANGALLPIAQNTALFSLLGTTYGGNGQTTFALPNLQGRAAIGIGQGPGLPDYSLGEQGGAPSFTVNTNQMPVHRHSVRATNVVADRTGPLAKYLGLSTDFQFHVGPPNGTMAADMLLTAGNGVPVAAREPYLAMTWCIALQGVFPPRS